MSTSPYLNDIALFFGEIEHILFLNHTNIFDNLPNGNFFGFVTLFFDQPADSLFFCLFSHEIFCKVDRYIMITDQVIISGGGRYRLIHVL